MIVTFPMLVSKAVSENSVAIIAKTAEIYLVVNNMDLIMSQPSVVSHLKSSYRDIDNFNFSFKHNRFVLGEGESNIIEQGGIGGMTAPGNKKQQQVDDEQERLNDEWKELSNREKELDRQEKEIERKIKTANEKEREFLQKQKEAKQKEKESLEREKFTYQKKQDEIKKAEEAAAKEEERRTAGQVKSAKASISDYKSIALEPTYANIEVITKDGLRRNLMVGIKVLPYRVKSEVRLSRLMLADAQLSSLTRSLVKLGRGVMRFLFRSYNRMLKMFRINTPPTGDPKKDIIFGRAGFEGTGFLLLSRNEDVDKYFLNNIGKLYRMFGLYWGNIIIADDINRQAHFCLKRFRGVCNTLTYASMYSNIGQTKVYETLEDVKKQQSSLFKMKRNLKNVVSEWIVEEKLNNYSIINEEYKNE